HLALARRHRRSVGGRGAAGGGLAQLLLGARGERGLDQGVAGCERAHRGDQPVERHVLEQEAAGAGAHDLDRGGVVVERGQDQGRGQLAAPRELLDDEQAVAVGHPHVEQQHVGVGVGHDLQRGLAARRLADQLEILDQTEQGADALAHERVIVDQDDPDPPHDLPPSGSCAVTANEGAGAMRRKPPSSSRRACMPDSPWPARSIEAPRPSSRASTASPPSCCSILTHRLLARAWRSVLVTISCTQRSTHWARAGSSMNSASGSDRCTVSPGRSSTSVRSASPRSVPSDVRILPTTSRTLRRRRALTSRALATCSGTFSAATWVAISSWRPSAVRSWPRTSWSSRAIRVRSLIRLASASKVRVERSSALAHASACSASASWRATYTATAAKLWNPSSAISAAIPLSSEYALHTK